MKISMKKYKTEMFPHLTAAGMHAASGRRQAEVPVAPFYSTAVLLAFTAVCTSGRPTTLSKL